MKIYLAAAYTRREELCHYRDALIELGHVVTSRWLRGPDQLAELGSVHSKLYAGEDLEDIAAADMVISFTEPRLSPASSGGRHGEFGVALATGKMVAVVGYRENIFHWLDAVQFFEDWDACLDHLSELRT